MGAWGIMHFWQSAEMAHHSQMTYSTSDPQLNEEERQLLGVLGMPPRRGRGSCQMGGVKSGLCWFGVGLIWAKWGWGGAQLGQG